MQIGKTRFLSPISKEPLYGNLALEASQMTAVLDLVFYPLFIDEFLTS